MSMIRTIEIMRLKTREEEYLDYLQQELEMFKEKALSSKGWSHLDHLADMEIGKVLDIGCGAGQQLLPFAQMDNVQCVGIDVTSEAGLVFSELFNSLNERQSNVAFVRSSGEYIPFDDNTFDVAICRVALPYMDNRKAISEIGRILRPGGRLLLKTHTPMFYIGMMKRRIKELSIKQMAYPIICLMGGIWHWITGKQPYSGLWHGKEVFQTTGIINREAKRSGMRVVKEETSSDREAKSYIIEKSHICNLIMAYYAELDILFLGLFVIH